MACVVMLGMGCGDWSKRELTLEALFVAEAAVDYNQSARITKDCHEANPFVGPCGRSTPIQLYFPLTVALHLHQPKM